MQTKEQGLDPPSALSHSAGAAIAPLAGSAAPTGKASGTTLTGTTLVACRILWFVLVLAYAALFLFGLPSASANARALSAATQSVLSQFGLTGLPAIYWLTLDTVTFAAFTFVAFFIVWRRSDDWFVMLTSLTLVGTATLYTVPPAEAPTPLLLTATLFALAEICQVSFVFLFPNGKFVPRWLWLFILPMFVWRPVIWGIAYLPNYHTLTHTAENYGTLPQDPFDTALMVGIFIIGIAAQIYRYRRVATPIERQQSKWLLFGVVVAITVTAAYVLVVNAFGLLEPIGVQALAVRMVGRPARQLALFMLPLSLTVAILRYRLWDVDLLLRGALIYIPLTALLAGLLAALGKVLQQVILEFTGEGTLLATVAATVIVVAAFDPLKRVLRRIVDKRFQASIEPTKKMEEFGKAVQRRMAAVESRHLISRFGAQAAEAFQAKGAIALADQGGKLIPISTVGDCSGGAVLTIPVTNGATRYGAIGLCTRTIERDYSMRERLALERTAHIVAKAIAQDEPIVRKEVR